MQLIRYNRINLIDLRYYKNMISSSLLFSFFLLHKILRNIMMLTNNTFIGLLVCLLCSVNSSNAMSELTIKKTIKNVCSYTLYNLEKSFVPEKNSKGAALADPDGEFCVIKLNDKIYVSDAKNDENLYILDKPKESKLHYVSARYIYILHEYIFEIHSHMAFDEEYHTQKVTNLYIFHNPVHTHKLIEKKKMGKELVASKEFFDLKLFYKN